MVARKVLELALAAQPVRLVVRESSFDRLLGELAAFELDLILSDAPLPVGSAVRAYAHPLGRSSVSWFAAEPLARKLERGFPGSLDGAPVLLPLEGLPMRRALDGAFARMKIRPRVVAELEDSALLKALGAAGVGAFPAPTAVAAEVVQQYRVRALGTFPVHERFFIITHKRRVDHPTIAALLARARAGLFA
jgi:LysR family transcriptional activator of nhaA